MVWEMVGHDVHAALANRNPLPGRPPSHAAAHRRCVTPQVKLYSRALNETEIKALRTSLGALGATCLYYNTTTGQWRPDGVTRLSVTDGGVQCVSDHLTEFSVVTPTTTSTTSAKTADSDGTGNAGVADLPPMPLPHIYSHPRCHTSTRAPPSVLLPL